MKFEFKIIVTITNGKKYTVNKDVDARELSLARAKMKTEILKIARNGYYHYEIVNSVPLNPTYYSPHAILSVSLIEKN